MKKEIQNLRNQLQAEVDEIKRKGNNKNNSEIDYNIKTARIWTLTSTISKLNDILK